MNNVIRIEMVMPSEGLAKAKFPEAKKTFVGGVGGLALKVAGLKPKIFLEGCLVVVEIGCRSEGNARQLLPMFEQQCVAAIAKEKSEKGFCISMNVSLKEDKHVNA